MGQRIGSSVDLDSLLQLYDIYAHKTEDLSVTTFVYFLFVHIFILQQFSRKLCNNCAFCDKSTKFGTEVENNITIKCGYWGTIDLTFGDLCSHFCEQNFSFLHLSPLGIIQATNCWYHSKGLTQRNNLIFV